MLAKTPEDGANLMLSVVLETGAMASGPDGWSGAWEEKDGHHLSRRPPAPW